MVYDTSLDNHTRIRTRYRLVIMVILMSVVGNLVAACGSMLSPDQPMRAAPPLPPEDMSDTDIMPIPAVIANLTEEERRRTVIWDVDIDANPQDFPNHWNPFLPYRRDKGLHQAMMEPLFILNYESGTIEPWLGERMIANETYDQWTLVLREGVTWSDGEPFGADDVIFSMQLMRDHPDLYPSFTTVSTNLQEPGGIQKIDNRTIVISLRTPNPHLQVDIFSVKIWGHFPIVPMHIWRDQDLYTFENYDPQRGWPVFTGPYLLQSFDETTFVYERDETWWGARAGFRPLPRPERLIWVITPTEADLIHLAVEHSLDSTGDVTLGTFQTIQAQNPNVISWLPERPYAWLDPCTRLLSPNHTVAPWGDKAMRWGLSAAINRDEIVERAYNGTTIPAALMFAAYPTLNRERTLLDDAGLTTTYPVGEYDPGRARAIMESRGWVLGSDNYYTKNGQRLTLAIQTHASFVEKQRVAAVIVEQLQAVGIDASTHTVDADTWVTNKRDGHYESVIDWDACGSIHEPWSSMNRYHARWVHPPSMPPDNENHQTFWEATENNHVRWVHHEYSDIVDEIAILPMGDPALDPLFIEAMSIWLDELPVIPITQAKKLIPFDTSYWSGWPTAEHNYIHPPTWWQSTHMIIHKLEPVH